MIIYTRTVDWDSLKVLWNYPDRAVSYVESLIPLWARCFPHIVDNQRFYHAIQIRGYISVAYKLRTPVVNELVKDIRLFGLCGEFLTVDELLQECDRESLIKSLRIKLDEGDLYTGA